MKHKELIRNFIFKNIYQQQDGNSLRDEDSLLDTGILDSLGIIKLISFLETHLSVKISNRELLPRNFESINTISSLVKSKITMS